MHSRSAGGWRSGRDLGVRSRGRFRPLGPRFSLQHSRPSARGGVTRPRESRRPPGLYVFRPRLGRGPPSREPHGPTRAPRSAGPSKGQRCRCKVPSMCRNAAVPRSITHAGVGVGDGCGVPRDPKHQACSCVFVPQTDRSGRCDNRSTVSFDPIDCTLVETPSECKERCTRARFRIRGLSLR